MHRARIVVAEDEMIVALDMKRRLECIGHCVLSMVRTGSAAIDHARMLDPDLLVMDISLEGELDGLSAVEAIWKVRRIPVVFVSGFSDDTTRRKISLLQPATLVPKPVEDHELQMTIENVLSFGRAS